jgi:hypothetical protein
MSKSILSPVETVEPLSAVEEKQLAKLEGIIHRTSQNTVEFFAALKEIHDKRLYRRHFGTFKDYCEAEFGKTVKAIEIMLRTEGVRQQLLLDSGPFATQGQPEYQEFVKTAPQKSVRELGKIKPEKRAEVFERAKSEPNRKAKSGARHKPGQYPPAPKVSAGAIGRAAAANDRRSVATLPADDLYKYYSDPPTPPRGGKLGPVAAREVTALAPAAPKPAAATRGKRKEFLDALHKAWEEQKEGCIQQPNDEVLEWAEDLIMKVFDQVFA